MVIEFRFYSKLILVSIYFKWNEKIFFNSCKFYFIIVIFWMYFNKNIIYLKVFWVIILYFLYNIEI